MAVRPVVSGRVRLAAGPRAPGSAARWTRSGPRPCRGPRWPGRRPPAPAGHPAASSAGYGTSTQPQTQHQDQPGNRNKYIRYCIFNIKTNLETEINTSGTVVYFSPGLFVFFLYNTCTF